ncbi:MAG: ABC transporter ATP-binding protein/permease [Bacteroidales bacterium]|nr:ABC transporter ATP-binding protein/permease [Bacteroidales bacterium]
MKKIETYYLFRTMRLIWRCSPKWSLANASLVIVRGLIPLAQLWAVKVVIDITSTQVGTGVFNLSEAALGLAIMASLFVISSATDSLHSIVKERHSYHLSNVIAHIIHHKTTTIGYGFFDDANYHDIFFRAVAESTSKPQGVFYNVINLIQNTLTIGSLAILLTAIHWTLPVIILVMGLPIVIVRVIFSRRYFALQREQTNDERKVQYYNRVLTAREFAKEIRTFHLAEHFKNLYYSTLASLRHKRLKLMIDDSIRESIVQLIASLLFVAVFGFVMYRAVTTQMSVGSLAMYLMALQRSYGVAQDILGRIASLYDSNLFLKNFYSFIDMNDSYNGISNLSSPTTEPGYISFENVSFSYPNTTRTVLSNISFSIEKGDTIAIVGRNGCGKSTIIKLICGLYKPTCGQVNVGGSISAIFQDFMLYNASAHDNIRFGNIHKTDTPQDIKQAAQKAGVDKLLSDLPHGYETQLGTLTAESEMLSQGEWQRIALSRSFYADSDIIVMDEPTSSLDAFTEASLIDNFRAITHGRTAVIVSHRIASIKMAQKIMVVDNHQIAEFGTYDQLISLNGLFTEMVRSLEK